MRGLTLVIAKDLPFSRGMGLPCWRHGAENVALFAELVDLF